MFPYRNGLMGVGGGGGGSMEYMWPLAGTHSHTLAHTHTHSHTEAKGHLFAVHHQSQMYFSANKDTQRCHKVVYRLPDRKCKPTGNILQVLFCPQVCAFLW